MEIQLTTIDTAIEQLRERAAEKQSALMVEARLVVNAQEARLIEVQAVTLLATIQY